MKGQGNDVRCNLGFVFDKMLGCVAVISLPQASDSFVGAIKQCAAHQSTLVTISTTSQVQLAAKLAQEAGLNNSLFVLNPFFLVDMFGFITVFL